MSMKFPFFSNKAAYIERKRKYIPMNLPLKQQEGRKQVAKNVLKFSISASCRTKHEQHTQTGQNIREKYKHSNLFRHFYLIS